MVAKINALEDEAVAFKETVQDSISLEHHVAERPWSVFGLAAVAGFVLARIVH
jgi:ElaB/YqjD/DUF883 family membrane-anchored ribosome-binding protein